MIKKTRRRRESLLRLLLLSERIKLYYIMLPSAPADLIVEKMYHLAYAAKSGTCSATEDQKYGMSM